MTGEDANEVSLGAFLCLDQAIALGSFKVTILRGIF